MIRSLLCTSLVLALMPQTSQANDIVDFFKAISAARSHSTIQRQAHPGYHPDIHSVSRRNLDGRTRLTSTRRFGSDFEHGHDHRRVDLNSYRRSGFQNSQPGRSGLAFHVNVGNSAPAPVYRPSGFPQSGIGHYDHGHHLPVPPLPQSPLPGQFQHLPHELGQIVTCPVPVYSHVHVECACNIAPNAVRTLVAVRDPALGRFRSCVERMVYVEVYAPPCPPRRVRVSPCRTKVRMDYGRYDITIESRDGCVTVTYDD